MAALFAQGKTQYISSFIYFALYVTRLWTLLQSTSRLCVFSNKVHFIDFQKNHGHAARLFNIITKLSFSIIALFLVGSAQLAASFFFYGPTINITDPAIPYYPNATVVSSTFMNPMRLYAFGSIINTPLLLSTVQTVAPNTVQVYLVPTEFAQLQYQIDNTYTGAFLLANYGPANTTIKATYFCMQIAFESRKKCSNVICRPKSRRLCCVWPAAANKHRTTCQLPPRVHLTRLYRSICPVIEMNHSIDPS